MALLSSFLTIFSLFAITLNVYNTISLPSLCSTLFILSSPIPILAYTRVDLIGPYLILVFIASLGCVVWSPHFQTPRNLINRIFEYRPKFPLILIAAAFIAFLTLYNFMPGRWFYEGHDIVYYGWINEVFKNDYTGPIRVSTAFPLELSANHLLATSILVPFQALSTHISIQSSLTVKYFFTFTVLTGFFYSYIIASTSVCSVLFGQHRTPNKLYLKKYFQISQIIAIPILIAYLYGWAEFDYNNSISSYSSLALLLLIAINVFERIFAHCQSISSSDLQHEEDTKSRLESRSIILVTLVALFCFSKATLFPVAIFAALAYVLDSLLAKDSNIKLKFIGFAKYVTRLNGADRIPVLLLICSLVMSFIGWVIKPSQHGTIALSFPLCLATDSVKIKTCLMSSLLNPFTGWDLLDKNPLKSNIIKYLPDDIGSYLYIWALIILPIYILSWRLIKNTSVTAVREFAFLIRYYSLGTALAVVLLRESSGASGAHTAHSYLIGSSIVSVSLVIAALDEILNKKSTILKIPLLKYMTITTFIALLTLALFTPISTTLSRRTALSLSPELNGSLHRPAITSEQSMLFDKALCTNIQTSLVPMIKAYTDGNRCATPPLQEILLAMRGERGVPTLNYDESLIGQWTIKKPSSLGNSDHH